MKRRMTALLLALMILVSVLPLSVQAATKTDVYNCFVQIAKSGSFNSDKQCWSKGTVLDDSYSRFYSVYYFLTNGSNEERIELTLFTTSWEISLTLNKSMKTPFRGYMRYFNTSLSTGNFELPVNYTGGALTFNLGFAPANDSLKAYMLGILNEELPWLIEYISADLVDHGLSLRDMGLTSYVHNTNMHVFGEQVVTNPATCVAAGTAVQTCRVCKKLQTIVLPIDPTNHNWVLTQYLTTPSAGNYHSCKGRYQCGLCGAVKEARLCAAEIFTDMPAEDHWAHKPIDWAYFNNITSGTTKTSFSPDMTITRAQAVTFLWAAAGKPEPKNPENPFTDVPDDGWYTKSVLWAVESGVTKGLSADTFGPFETCTRAQIVTFLWAAAGKPEPKNSANPFTDVPNSGWFTKPVLWAVENGITKGLSADSFGPYASCTRAQVVTFLYKASLIKKQINSEPLLSGSISGIISA